MLNWLFLYCKETDKLKRGGLQEKRAVAAWNCGSASGRLLEET